jgi:cobalt/nickel transport system permease protein
MHIPDGYLSPATCAVTYAVALPFWYMAFARVKRLLHTRMVPLLAVFSAFSFVIMMFNLPLPGGTTGHAVGMAIAAIVLGPWAAMVAISIALLIQAVFFGDGGITTFAANSLNMAVVGSLVAYWTYTLIAGKSALDSSRRVVAAAIAGYLAINVAALLTAVEFGLQPLLAHDATGTPLYAPYPLSIAVPAMMLGHLSFAGLAELLVSGGLVAYLQRANPELLTNSRANSVSNPWQSTRKLWYALAGLMLLTPLGILAGGTAWGEWGVEDFAKAEVRQEILRASGNVAPPTMAPQGLQQLASVWTAPIPDYAPGFLRSPSFGYALSALFGAGLILLLFLIISRFPLIRWKRPQQ